ncbi:MAG: hypothetical protein SFU98_01495 [Leptospiraceae bacterium]|nr:hypothetical protein [Leptospiraceae bacterium]
MKQFTLLIIFLFFIQCSGREVRLTVQGASYCLSSKLHLQTESPTLEEATAMMADSELTTKFSPKSIRMAIAYGIFKDLKEFTRLAKGNKNSPELLKLETKIYKTLQAISLDIDSITSEYSCYVDRFTEIITMMKEKEDDIVQSNTLYAIMSGAIAAILDGSTVYDTGFNQGIILTGGILVSYFSYRAFNPNITIEFKPKSTNLKEIWFNVETSSNYSKPMWFLMTKPLLKDELCIRDLLAKRWVENHFLGSEEEREYHINLFFGEGGVSTINHITNRREMNNEVRSLIFLLKQDLKGLQIEMENLLKK